MWELMEDNSFITYYNMLWINVNIIFYYIYLLELFIFLNNIGIAFGGSYSDYLESIYLIYK